MAKQSVTYTFDNPNRADVVEKMLRQILMDKLAAQNQKDAAA